MLDTENEDTEAGIIWIELIYVLFFLLMIYILKKFRDWKVEYVAMLNITVANCLIIAHMYFNPSKNTHDLIFAGILAFSFGNRYNYVFVVVVICLAATVFFVNVKFSKVYSVETANETLEYQDLVWVRTDLLI